MLRAYGAEVVITPTAVEPDSPESYYSVSSRLAEEIPGGFKPDQYSNMANPQAHYEVDGAGDPRADRRRARRDRDLGRHRRHDLRRRPLLQGARAERADRRRRSGRLGLHGAARRRRPPVPRRGDRQGHVARDDGSRRSSTSGSASPTATRSSRRAAARARGGAARRRLRRHDGLGRARAREAARAGQDDPLDAPRQRPLVPLEVLRRQLDARARLRRAAHGAADGRAAARGEARRGARGARPDHDLVAPEGRRGDRRHAALFDLAAAGRARRPQRVARGLHRLAAGSRPARPRVQEPGRAARGRRVGDAAAARRGRDHADASTRSSRR